MNRHPCRRRKASRRVPGPAGGVEWNGPAFDPGLHRLYVGSLDYCAIFRAELNTKPEIGALNMGGTWTGIGTPRGWLYALDADTGAVAWRYHADHPMLSGTTPTAGGVLFAGDNSGTFMVFDSESGEILKETETGGSLSGGVITYLQQGRQFVAMTSGNVSRTLFGAVGRPTIVVMALPESMLAKPDREGPDVDRGFAAYQANCQICHGPQGSDWKPVELKSAKLSMTFDELAEYIKNPREPMPRVFPAPVSDEAERTIQDITAFIMQWK